MAKKSIDKERLDREADEFANKHDLNVDQIRKLFARLVEHGWYQPGFPIDTQLNRGIQLVGAQRVVETLESEEDLEVFLGRHILLTNLLSPSIPFYTLDDLANLIFELLQHQAENKQRLLNTGFPLSPFKGSLWADRFLSKLYYVKFPLVNPLLDNWQSVKFDTWAEEPPKKNPKLFLTKQEPLEGYREPIGWPWRIIDFFINGDLPATPCEYEKAAHLPGLLPEIIEFISLIREEVFSCKIVILGLINLALLQRDASRLWENCIETLHEKLLHKWVEHLLGTDIYYHRLFGTGPNSKRFFTPVGTTLLNSGLMQLFQVIGHCEKEIKFKTMHKACERIGGLPIDFPLSDYFQAFGQSWRNELDSILSDFKMNINSKKERKFWQNQSLRIRDAIHRFDIIAEDETRIPEIIGNKYNKLIRVSKNFVREYLSTQIQRPELTLSSYGGETHKDVVGSKEFAQLLKNAACGEKVVTGGQKGGPKNKDQQRKPYRSEEHSRWLEEGRKLLQWKPNYSNRNLAIRVKTRLGLPESEETIRKVLNPLFKKENG